MKRIKFLIMSLSIIIMSAVLTSCEGIDGPDPPPQIVEMIIHLEYDGLEDFQGELSRIGIFVTDENGSFIVRLADEINDNMIIYNVTPGIYVISAEYIIPDTDNIILGSTRVELKGSLDIPLKIDFNKIQIQNNN
ncbi:hypothetical protein [uncultured Duncaniella sp.]|uniref:hypothetical protein n=1 Tax=uncultured Duncaniella sp. TaxID=2768039 RepID=UPI0026752C00|nr:hypothetical protein [uncultured Duncaniella sp.]